MDREDGYKQMPNMETHKCFGCGPMNPSGLRMKFYANDESVCSWITVPEHLCGWKNLVHGGIISTILDEMMGRSILYFLKCLGLTKSMQVDFIKPVYIGEMLKAEGRVLERKSDREALVEGLIFNHDGELCNRSTGTFGLFTADFLRERNIADEETLQWLEAFLTADRGK